jgi:hypothetical protein
MLLRRKHAVPDHLRRAARLGAAVALLSSIGFTLTTGEGPEGLIMAIKWACLTCPVVTMPLLGKVRLLLAAGRQAGIAAAQAGRQALLRRRQAGTAAARHFSEHLPMALMRPHSSCFSTQTTTACRRPKSASSAASGPLLAAAWASSPQQVPPAVGPW